MKKLVNESLNESLSHQFSPNELYVVMKSDGEKQSLEEIDTIYTDEGDARPEAMFKNSQGYKNGMLSRSSEYKVYTIEDIISMFI